MLLIIQKAHSVSYFNIIKYIYRLIRIIDIKNTFQTSCQVCLNVVQFYSNSNSASPQYHFQNNPLNASGTMSSGLAMNSSIILHLYFANTKDKMARIIPSAPCKWLRNCTHVALTHLWPMTGFLHGPLCFDKGKVKQRGDIFYWVSSRMG